MSITGRPIRMQILFPLIFASCCLICIYSCSNNIDTARKKAIKEVEYFMQEYDIDINLFQGPTLAQEIDDDFVFQWKSALPITGTSIVEISVPKERWGRIGFDIKGERENFGYLGGTTKFPLKEALLRYLFELPISPDILDERVKWIKKVALPDQHLENIVNFDEIKFHLLNYYFNNNSAYPDSITELKLDDLFTHDKFGKVYYYNNLGSYVLLGTQGSNDKWNFDKATLDSLINSHKEFILTDDEDILVKFKPVYM